MNLNDLINQCMRFLQAGRKFRFVEQAHLIMAGAPDVGPLAMHTLGTLLELGLGGPARELLQFRRELASLSDLDEVKRTIAMLPNGRIRWADRKDVFVNNLEVLLRNRPHLQQISASFEKLLGDLELFQTLTGEFQASYRRKPRYLRQWLPALTDDGEEQTMNIPPRGQLGAPLVVGIRQGPVIPRLYEDSKNVVVTYSDPLYLLEPDPRRFAAWLHIADHTELFNDERVYIFVGEDCGKQLTQLLLNTHNLSLPSTHVRLEADPPFVEKIVCDVEQVQVERDQQTRQLSDSLNKLYEDRGPAYWLERLSNPKHVMAITSKHTTVLQYSARDMLAVFEERGCDTQLLVEEDDHHPLSAVDMCQCIEETDPDLILAFDHLRYETPFIPKNIPFLCWIQDALGNLLCQEAGQSIGVLDFVCGYFQTRCVKEFGYPKERFFSVPIPVSTRQFNDTQLDADAREKYECDISFISNASVSVEQLLSQTLQTVPDSFAPLLRELHEQAPNLDELYKGMHPGFAAIEMAREAVQRRGIRFDEPQIQHLGTHFVYRIYDWGRRQETLHWVADWARRTGRSFRIYGRGWDEHPTLGEFSYGPLEHGEPLRQAYCGSTLSLQLIPSGFMHQRSYEMLASGTLPLTRYCSEDFAGLSLDDYLNRDDTVDVRKATPTIMPGFEHIVFRSSDEFERVAEQFLADSGMRRNILAGMQKVVLDRFTYRHAVDKIMDAFCSRLKQDADSLTPSEQQSQLALLQPVNQP